MSEIYWITRVGVITNFLEIFIIICIILGACAILGYAISRGEFYDRDDIKKLNNFYIKGIKIYIPTIAIAIVLRIFIPTTNEMLMIYGIGGTIDYTQDNDKAKELPDKVIDALDMYLDNVNKEKDNE